MEHRWGTRRTLEVGVTLYGESKLPQSARLVNASSSGAYVATNTRLPLMARVHVALGWDTSHRGRHRIAAHVVRVDGGGIGIEWHEFAPPPVLALISTPDAPPAWARSRASLGGIRMIAAARPEGAYLSLRRSAP